MTDAKLIDALRAAVKRGTSHARIAADCGVSERSIFEWIKSNRVPKNALVRRALEKAVSR